MSTATAKQTTQTQKTKDFIHELRVKPQDQLRVFLGRFEIAEKFKGFAIEVRPSTIPENAVVTRVTRVDGEFGTKFFLDIANKGVRSVKARVHQV